MRDTLALRRAAAAVLAALALILAVPPASAQRSRCGFGQGLEALRAAERALQGAGQLPSLAAGRDLAAEAAGHLHRAAEVLAGCLCRRAAPEAWEAARIAEQAISEASAARLAATLERARFSLRLVQERLDRAGCE